MTKSVNSKQERITALLLFFSNLIICLMIWMEHTYDQVMLDQLLFQIKSPSTGVYGALSASAVFYVGFFSVGLTALEALLYKFLSEKWYEKHPKFLYVRKHLLSVAAAILLITLAVFGTRMEIIPYVKADVTDSTFIQTHYVKPENSILRFPEQKRNPWRVPTRNRQTGKQ